MNFSDEELDELLGAYALDAVDEHERSAVERYLERSSSAREEVRNHYEVAMALATTPGQAPMALWDRIEANMKPHVTETVDPSTVTLGSDSTSSRTLAFPGVRWVAAAAAALLIASFATVSVRQHRTITALRSDVAAARATARTNEMRAEKVERLLTTTTAKERTIQLLLATSGTTVAHLDTASGVSVVEVILAPDGQGYLVSKALPALSSDRTYQLWGVADDVVLSLGVFGSAPKTLEFAAHQRWTKFVLTEEQSPGVPTSSQPAFAVGEVQQI
jgi:Anti-sigma-K factor rskA